MKELHTLRSLEDLVARQTRRKKIETAVLGTVLVAGMVPVAVLAPNALSIFKTLNSTINEASKKQSIRRAINRLITSGDLERSSDGAGWTLSERGRRKLTHLVAHTRDERPSTWDGKWRIVIFDVPESRKKLRDTLRHQLQAAGFRKIQDSVWAYPYRCEDIIALLKFELRLGRSLLYLIADTVEGDEVLRTHFKLPKDRS
ncbi:hypothetical protein GVX82_01190 [Patescibacteria group bacterium]|jgi:DNA-binding transcriptional regulator PaaX|nr:hypothetical protein [Patescibacteria group bacterium]